MKKLILDIAKVIGAVATIGGSALWFDSRFDDSATQQEDVLELVEYINVEQQIMSEDINGIKDSVKGLENKLDVVQEEQNNHHDAIENLGWAIRNQNDFTPEQMEDILDRMLKKNNELVVNDGTLHSTPVD